MLGRKLIFPFHSSLTKMFPKIGKIEPQIQCKIKFATSDIEFCRFYFKLGG